MRSQPGIVAPGSSVLNGKGGALLINPNVSAPNTVNVKNTIIARNSFSSPLGGEIFADCSGALPSDMGYNIELRASCGFSAANNSQPNTDPRLVPSEALADNGGPTATVALCTGVGTPALGCQGISPAIDAIPNGTNGCGSPINQDQRGVPRPANGNGDATAECDIGAFEVEATVAGADCGDGVPLS